jgi:hypothetical protein
LNCFRISWKLNHLVTQNLNTLFEWSPTKKKKRTFVITLALLFTSALRIILLQTCLKVDPKGTGSVGALDAATFMKKSGLAQTVLSQVSRTETSNEGSHIETERKNILLEMA